MSGLYGVLFPPCYRWPFKLPADVADYSFDCSGELTAPVFIIGASAIGEGAIGVPDTIIAVSLSIAPSGTGELQASSLSVTSTVVTMWLAGGVAGREYTVQLVITTAEGRSLTTLITLPMDPTLATYPAIDPPSDGFGTALNWP
jgi:hypothetical protein